MTKRFLTVVGLDITLSNMGWCRLQHDGDGLALLDIGLHQTKKADKAQRKTISASGDYLGRARSMHEALHRVTSGADVVISEIPTIASQSSAAVWSFGITFGLLAGLKIPLVPVTPLAAKKAALMAKGASKRDMITWATTLFPDASWIRARGKKDGAITDANEHIADAIAVAYVGISDPMVRTMLDDICEATEK